MKKVIAIALLSLVGCSGSTEPDIPPTSGGFVDSRGGVGTAQVFGIDFTVSVNSGGVTSEQTIHANFLDAEQSSAKSKFTFGDDLTVELESLNKTEVHFLFNDEDYGILNVGDKVSIDEKGNVTVNEDTRAPTDVESS